MPLDPERPIEALLRRYAAKRRAQGGAPPGLHPVNRRLLQSEARKEFPLPVTVRPAGSSIFRPVWGWALGAATALLVLSAAVFFIDRGAREETVTLAMDEQERYHRTIETRTPPAAPAAGEPAQASQRRISLPSEESLNRGARVDEAPALTTPAGAPTAGFAVVPGATTTTSTAGKELVAKGQVVPTVAAVTEGVAGDRFDHVMGGSGSLDRAMTNAPSAGVNLTSEVALRDSALVETPSSKALEVAAGQTLERAPSSTRAGRTAQPLPPIAALDKSKVAAVVPAAATPPVLDSFQVEQDGESLRIVDSDGSVYAGALQLVAPEGEAFRELTVRSRPMHTADPQSTALAARPQAAPAQQQQQQWPDQNWNFAFKVSGTNRSLKQNVVFTGNLVGPPLPQGLRFANNVVPGVENKAEAQRFYAAAALASSSNQAQTNYFGAAAVLQQNRASVQDQNQVQQLLQNSISGQAKLSDGRTVEVNALAVPSNQR